MSPIIRIIHCFAFISLKRKGHSLVSQTDKVIGGSNPLQLVSRHKGLLLPPSLYNLILLSIHFEEKRQAMRILSLLLLAIAARAADPKVAVTRFKNLPSKLFYFEDTPVRLPLCVIILTDECLMIDHPATRSRRFNCAYFRR
jgi:hypothetical protein